MDTLPLIYEGESIFIKKALADYTRTRCDKYGNDPAIDKTELIKWITAIISETESFLKGKGFTLE